MKFFENFHCRHHGLLILVLEQLVKRKQTHTHKRVINIKNEDANNVYLATKPKSRIKIFRYSLFNTVKMYHRNGAKA